MARKTPRRPRRATSSPRTVLGVDPGYRAMGWCLVTVGGAGQPTVVGRGTVGGKGPALRAWRRLVGERLRALTAAVPLARPDRVVVEAVTPPYRRGAVALAHLAGAVAGVYWARGAEVRWVSPARVKPLAARRGDGGGSAHERDAEALCRLSLDDPDGS